MLNRPPVTTRVHFHPVGRSAGRAGDDSRGRLPAVTEAAWIEQLMIKGARFRRGEFARLFLDERRSLAARVLWATYDADSGTRYFVVDETDDFEVPPGRYVGVPYITELGSLTRAAARRLIGAPLIDQLDRPQLLPEHPSGTVLDLGVLDDASLWSAASALHLRSAGFGQAADGSLRRRYHYIDRHVDAVFVPGAPSERLAVKLITRDTAHVPLPILNELLLEVARALVPQQASGFPRCSAVHMGTLCTLCGDSIEEGERAFVYQRPADSSLRLAALHQSCQPFSLAARYLG